MPRGTHSADIRLSLGASVDYGKPPLNVPRAVVAYAPSSRKSARRLAFARAPGRPSSPDRPRCRACPCAPRARPRMDRVYRFWEPGVRSLPSDENPPFSLTRTTFAPCMSPSFSSDSENRTVSARGRSMNHSVLSPAGDQAARIVMIWWLIVWVSTVVGRPTTRHVNLTRRFRGPSLQALRPRSSSSSRYWLRVSVDYPEHVCARRLERAHSRAHGSSTVVGSSVRRCHSESPGGDGGSLTGRKMSLARVFRLQFLTLARSAASYRRMRSIQPKISQSVADDARGLSLDMTHRLPVAWG